MIKSVVMWLHILVVSLLMCVCCIVREQTVKIPHRLLPVFIPCISSAVIHIHQHMHVTEIIYKLIPVYMFRRNMYEGTSICMTIYVVSICWCMWMIPHSRRPWVLRLCLRTWHRRDFYLCTSGCVNLIRMELRIQFRNSETCVFGCIPLPTTSPTHFLPRNDFLLTLPDLKLYCTILV